MNNKSQEEVIVIYFLLLENLQATLYSYHTLFSKLSFGKSKHFSITTKDRKVRKTAYIIFIEMSSPKIRYTNPEL